MTRKELFNASKPLFLAQYLSPPKGQICRVRVSYAKEIENIEYLPYVPRKIESFTLVESRLEYPYKICAREDITKLLQEGSDDIIIVRKGMLKDTSIANIALQLNGVWYTPKEPF